MKKKKNKQFKKILIPEILSISLVALVYLFVGEIFSKDLQWSNSFLAVIPGSLYLVLTSVAVKRPRIGGGLFAILGAVLFLFNIWQGRDTLAAYFLALVTFVLGFLFIYFNDKKVRV